MQFYSSNVCLKRVSNGVGIFWGILGLSGLSLGLFSCTSRSVSEPPNTIHIATPAKLKGLDPIYSDDTYSATQVSQVYETLLQFHYLKRPYTLIPNLAEAMPEVSKDGLTYVFHLKKGVLFQDNPCFMETKGKGREMTAEDAVYSFKRLADPKLAAPGWWVLDGKLLGLNQWRENASKAGKADYSIPVEGLKAIDRYTVQLKLNKKSFQFLYGMALTFTAIVPKEAVAFYGKDFVNHPVGTGPFRLVEFNPSSRIVWEKNPSYRKEVYPSEGESTDQQVGLLEDAGKTLPLSDRVEIQIMVESQPRWLNFLAGKLDLIGIPKDNFSSAMTANKELNPELKSKGITLKTTTDLDVTRVVFNMNDPILGKNKYLRQAMSLAHDEATFIELFYNGRGIPAQGPVPPGLAGYDSSFKNPYRQFNVAKAKELLAKAGFPEGRGLPVFEYGSLADSVGRQVSEYFQKTMAAIGVTLNVHAYSWPQYQEAMKNGKLQVWESAWVADYPDAENFLQLFYSKNKPPGPNEGAYSSSTFDQLYEQSLALPDGPQRTALYRKMVETVVEDSPWIFGAHRLGYYLVQPWFKNYKPDDFIYTRIKYYRVDPEIKNPQSQSKKALKPKTVNETGTATETATDTETGAS